MCSGVHFLVSEFLVAMGPAFYISFWIPLKPYIPQLHQRRNWQYKVFNRFSLVSSFLGFTSILVMGVPDFVHADP